MKPFRIPVLALVVVALAATVSLAAPPSSAPPGQTNEEAPGRDKATLAQTLEGEEAVEDEDVVEPKEDGGIAPDHSACEGLTGLENAACRVHANFEAHPNRGLENALSRLEGNLAKAGAGSGGPPDDVEPRWLEVAAAHGAAIAGA
jgi:hypothetical protein